MARKFLIAFAALVGILIVGAVALNQFALPLLTWYLVPSEPFDAATLPPAPDYSNIENWAAADEAVQSTASLRPAGVDYPQKADVAIFYVHPTGYWDNDAWVASLDNEPARQKLDELFLKGQASAFDPYGSLYAPYYRQAALGAFLARDDNTAKALGVAFSDVRNAFANFLERIGPDKPFILAGHSQGALHALTLLHASLQSPELQNRLIAAYLIGWTIAPDADLPAWIAPCEAAGDIGCVITWQSFGPDGDPSPILEMFKTTPSFTGASKEGETMLCINPLTFTRTTQPIDAAQNLGAVAITAAGQPLDAPQTALVGARCGDDGILYLMQRPGDGFDQLVMPGDNFHMQDIQLFYRNIQENVAAQIAAFQTRRSAPSQ